ncbi:MAG: pseudouridine synthase [Holdemania massiliensis]
MRLDKFLAHAGLGTRKEVKELVRKGRVEINGQRVKKDDLKIDEQTDQVCVDGEIIAYESAVYIMLNKPQGVVSATEDSRYSTVLDCLESSRNDLFPVGRLDIDTEGLLLITNDGALAHDLLSPKKHVDKTYEVHLEKLGILSMSQRFTGNSN